jgi:hypothetical protein
MSLLNTLIRHAVNAGLRQALKKRPGARTRRGRGQPTRDLSFLSGRLVRQVIRTITTKKR